VDPMMRSVARAGNGIACESTNGQGVR